MLQFAETATAGREPFEELDCDGHALASSQDFAEPQLPFCRRSPKKREEFQARKDLIAARGSPNGIRTRVSTLRGRPGQFGLGETACQKGSSSLDRGPES